MDRQPGRGLSRRSALPALVLLALALPVAGLLAGCGSKSAPRQAPPPRVYTLRVEPASVPLWRSYVGRVSAYRSANVVARVAGVLRRRLYREGSAVRRGQPLFEIDPAYYRAQLDSDLALLAEDRASLANDRVTLARDRRLLRIGALAQQTVDNDLAAQRSAAAKVQADLAQVAGARLALGYTRVVAPIAGIAGQQQVTAGAVVGSGVNDGGAGGTLLTTVSDIDRVYLNFTISSSELLQLRTGQARRGLQAGVAQAPRVDIELPDGGRYPLPGRLDYAGARVDPATGAVDMRALVANPRHLLLPGMYLRLRVELGRRDGVFLVPQQALQRDAEGAYVLALGADGKVVRSNVVARDTYGNDWMVERGLVAGEQVIVSGLQRARIGRPARAAPWRPPAAAASGPAG